MAAFVVTDERGTVGSHDDIDILCPACNIPIACLPLAAYHEAIRGVSSLGIALGIAGQQENASDFDTSCFIGNGSHSPLNIACHGGQRRLCDSRQRAVPGADSKGIRGDPAGAVHATLGPVGATAQDKGASAQWRRAPRRHARRQHRQRYQPLGLGTPGGAAPSDVPDREGQVPAL